MKNYRYYLSVTSQFYFCGIPFRLDISPKCDLNCIYCFAMARGGRRTDKHQVGNPDNLRKKFEIIKQKKFTIRGLTNDFLINKIPVHFGGMSDPFSNDTTTKLSLDFLALLSKNDYPVVISTKFPSRLLTKEAQNILIKLKYLIIQVSFSVYDMNISKIIEPSSPSPQIRLQKIKLLSDLGYNVSVRLQPIIFPYIDELKSTLIPELSKSGCKHVTTEFLKIPVERNIANFKILSNILNWDIYKFYKDNNAKLIGREWLLPPKFIYDNITPLTASIKEQGMSHGYGDYGLYHLSDTLCCCGLDRFNGFEFWHKGNFSHVLKLSKPGKLFFKSIEDFWFSDESINEIINSHSRLNAKKMLDYLRHKWNSPGTTNAPDSYLGIVSMDQRDNNGNIIYFKEDLCH